jgi:hypothetical protein
MTITPHNFDQPQTVDKSDPIIGVRVLFADVGLEVAKCFFPEQNRIGTDLLRRLLVARLEEDGIHVVEATSHLPFNRSSYLFVLDSHALTGRAMGVIHEELDAIGVGIVSQIGWWDSREQIWRLTYPKKVARLAGPSPEEVASEDAVIDAAKHLFVEVLKAIEKMS